MNGMDWVEFIRRTEDKMFHIHRAIDGLCNELEYKESVSALTEVLRDYQLLIERAKDELRATDVHHDHHRDREHHGYREHYGDRDYDEHREYPRYD